MNIRLANAPQSVTQRYVTNLIRAGKNNVFHILSITRTIAVEDEVCVGHYYRVVIGAYEEPETMKSCAAGVTPGQALTRALEKFGVTFR